MHSMTKRSHIGYAKKSTTSQQGKIGFLKKPLANLFNGGKPYSE